MAFILGQDDLNNADIEKIRDAGLHLGISTRVIMKWRARMHLGRLILLVGLFFQLPAKSCHFCRRSVNQLQRWRATLNYPLVAIGGINNSNFSDILNTKVHGIAMISAITQAQNPLESTKHFLNNLSYGA